MEEEIKKLQHEWNILTRELKDMSSLDSSYGVIWDERADVGRELKELKRNNTPTGESL